MKRRYPQPLPAWSGNLGKRLTRSPKIHFCDSALAAHLSVLSHDRVIRHPELGGSLLDNFVLMELRKQPSWSGPSVSLFHHRTHAGREVDVVLEDRAGRVLGVEVKARSTLSGRDFKGLKELAQDVGEDFLRGILLYPGTSPLEFGPDRLAAERAVAGRILQPDPGRFIGCRRRSLRRRGAGADNRANLPAPRPSWPKPGTRRCRDADRARHSRRRQPRSRSSRSGRTW